MARCVKNKRDGVTYDVEPGLTTGPCGIGQRVVGRTSQWLVAVVGRHVADV